MLNESLLSEDVFIESLQASIDSFFKSFKPKKRLSPSEWAEKKFYIPPECSTSQRLEKWHNDTVPYLPYILDLYVDSRVRRIILKMAAQTGKTTVDLVLLGYIIDQNPGATLFVFSDIKRAEIDFTVPRLLPTIRHTPALAEKFRFNDKRQTQNKEMMQFDGGYIRLAGPSPEDLRSRPQRDIFIDELSAIKKLESDKEGSILSLAEKRQENFWDAKTVISSTPLLEGECEISDQYESSKRFTLEVPCPHRACGEWLTFELSGLRYDDKDPKGSAFYECPHCEGRILDKDKPRMLARVRPLCLDPEKPWENVGFHVPSFFSPWVSFGKLAQKHFEARLKPEKMQSFYNLELALSWSHEAHAVDALSLRGRSELYLAEVPRPVVVITGGVDVNQNDLTAQLIGWAATGEPYVIAYKRILGDPEFDETWDKLSDFLFRPLRHELGLDVTVDAFGVDTHFKKDKAEAFVKKYRSRGAYAVQGFSEDWRKIVDAPYHKRQRGNKKRLVPLVPVGDHQAKLSIYSKLKVKEDGHKDRIHFPMGEDWRNIDDRYFRELTAEKLKRERGRLRFERPKGRRNEALDTFKYGYAIFLLKDYRLKQREALLLDRAARLEEKRERGDEGEAEGRRELLKRLLKEALQERLREKRR